MTLKNLRLTEEEFEAQRKTVLAQWPTGADVNMEDGVAFHKALPVSKVFGKALEKGDKEGKVLLQPRAGVALLEDHIRLLNRLEEEADLLPTTIDSYTRQNLYQEAQKGIEKSLQAGTSMLNGFPAVNHGVAASRAIVERTKRPVQVRHGTPDARLLAEITLCAGFTSFEGGGISYNIPYAKKVPLAKSIADWQYVDRLTGRYEEQGVSINREPFGPLSGTLVPPFISHCVAILEGLLALEQGVRSITLGYGQGGNLIQDIAAIASLKELAHHYFKQAGYHDYTLTTVFHQWMGGFPEDESKAAAVITWGGAAASLSGATKVIVKSPHEASGIPTAEANLQGLRTTRQTNSMVADQTRLLRQVIVPEKNVIMEEVHCLMERIFALGEGDAARGAAAAFEAGVLDVPFAPSSNNMGKLLPVRDDQGMIRIFEWGQVPMKAELRALHKDKISERAEKEKRSPSFQMVIDDIYAISKGRLVGRPR